MASNVTIKGLDKLQKKLGGVNAAIVRGIKAGTLHIKGKIAKYPPSTIANSPSMPRWYERGYGSKWRTKAGIRGRKSSENLGRKWTVSYENGGMTGRVGNNVSYGPYVQGPEQQAHAMWVIGWKTTDDVADEEIDTVLDFINKQVDKALEG